MANYSLFIRPFRKSTFFYTFWEHTLEKKKENIGYTASKSRGVGVGGPCQTAVGRSRLSRLASPPPPLLSPPPLPLAAVVSKGLHKMKCELLHFTETGERERREARERERERERERASVSAREKRGKLSELKRKGV